MIDLRMGDCIEVMDSFESESVDAIITSPPYFNAKEYSVFLDYGQYLDFLTGFTEQCYRVLRESRILVVNLSCVIRERAKRQEESRRLAIPFHYVGVAESVGFRFVDDIIWEKPLGAAVGRGKGFSIHRQPVAYKPFSVTEYLLVFKKGDGLIDYVIREHSLEDRVASSVVGDYEKSNIWRINPEICSEHPAPFPLTLVQNAVRYYSFTNDTILDPFMGSGTTGVACARLGRNFMGIEINPEYFRKAQIRINNALADMGKAHRILAPNISITPMFA